MFSRESCNVVFTAMDKLVLEKRSPWREKGAQKGRFHGNKYVQIIIM